MSDKLAWGKVRELQTDPIHLYLSFGNYWYKSLCFHYILSFFKMSRVGTLYSIRLPVSIRIKVDPKIVINEHI